MTFVLGVSIIFTNYDITHSMYSFKQLLKNNYNIIMLSNGLHISVFMFLYKLYYIESIVLWITNYKAILY